MIRVAGIVLAQGASMSKRHRTALSAKDVESAKPKATAYRLHDAKVPGLSLRVLPSGVKSWNVTWARNRSLALGTWPGVTVDSARTKARAKLSEADQHGEPLSVIEANRPEAEKPISLRDFVEKDFKPWALAHQKAGQATVDAIESVWGDLYDKLLTDLTALDVERIKTRRLKAGRKPATVNRDLDRIRGVLSRAVEWGRLPAHPLKAVKRAKGQDNSRVRYLSADEEKQLRAALKAREQLRRQQRASGNEWCSARGEETRPVWPASGFTDHLMPLVLLAMNTGLRRGELFGLEWRSVNLAEKKITVTAGTAKSRKARHVPLSAEALDVLTRWRAQCSGSGLVFPGVEGGRLTNINKSWDGIAEDAELTDFRFHDLRHDFASKLVMGGVDLNVVRALLGHADIAMTLRYAHLAPEKLAAAVALIGAKSPTKKTTSRRGKSV
jgi:integrase